MEKFQGGPHGSVYNPNTGMIYDVNHPNNGNTNGLNSWLNGGQRSVGYKFNMNDNHRRNNIQSSTRSPEFLKEFKDSGSSTRSWIMDQLYARAMEQMLEAEMDPHMGYAKHSPKE